MKIQILKTTASHSSGIKLEAGILYDIPLLKTIKKTGKQYGIDFRKTNANDYGYELVFWSENITRTTQILKPSVDFVIIDASKKEKQEQNSLL